MINKIGTNFFHIHVARCGQLFTRVHIILYLDVIGHWWIASSGKDTEIPPRHSFAHVNNMLSWPKTASETADTFPTSAPTS